MVPPNIYIILCFIIKLLNKNKKYINYIKNITFYEQLNIIKYNHCTKEEHFLREKKIKKNAKI